jgi:glyoxylase-like metal-dependent hydrolase (beta-lactamase superfamily II)
MKISLNAEILLIGDRPLYLLLTWDDENLVLIDAGLPNQADLIAKAISKAGFDVKDLTHIILTHQDVDHIGSVKELQKIAPNVKVLAHAEEAPYIDGRKTPVKLAARLARYEELTEDEKEQVKSSQKFVDENRIPIDQELSDEQILPICGGIEVVHTPGHTPGHICLFLHEGQIMVLGDSANVDAEKGEIIDFYPIYIQDMSLAEKSIEKINRFPMQAALSHHTGLLRLTK